MKKSRPPPQLVHAEQACEAAGITRATLYAYVSRGLVRAMTDPSDARRSLYDKRDVDALLARRKRSRARSEIAHSTINWGEPILRSTVSQIRDGRLFYRGEDAVALADAAGVEAVVALLTGTEMNRSQAGEASGADPNSHPMDRIAMDLAAQAARSTGQDGPRRGARLINRIAAVGSGADAARADQPLHIRVARGLGATPGDSDIIRRALILCADHELNPSCYAARIAASTGANLASALLAGIATFNGPQHGRMPDRCATWLDTPEHQAAPYSVELPPPGFGHRLYPDGDIRAIALLAQCPATQGWQRRADAVFEKTGHRPNVTFALACVERRLQLSKGAAPALFAIGRSIGWVAHVLEQRKSGAHIRPRAFV